MLRALEYTVALLALSMACERGQAAGQVAHGTQPSALAYLRRLALPQAAPLAASATAGKRDAAGLDRALLVRVCAVLGQKLESRLTQSGSSVLRPSGEVPAWVAERETGRPSPDVLAARRLARETGADACVCVAVDRAGVRDALFRELWIRAIVWVVPANEENVRGPVFALSVARTAPRLLGRGHMRADDELADEAASACAGQAYGALDRGEQSPFAEDVRVAILPADMPDNIEVRSALGRVLHLLPAALSRQSDVLFQPEVGPIADLSSREEVRGAMEAAGVDEAALWRGGDLDTDAVADLGRHLTADYVFCSRAQSVSLMPDLSEADDTAVGEVAEAIVELALLRVADGAIVWRSVQSGTARNTMYAPSGSRRVRTREQCVLDAAVTAYAYGRFSLEDWARRRRK